MWTIFQRIIWLQIAFICCKTTLQQDDVPPAVLGDFESIPGGRGNIAEFGKALRLPTSLADRNIVQFYKNGNTYYHRFLFENSSFTLAFPFTFGDTMSTQIHDKIIDYSYNLEPTDDPYRATIFARYEERNSIMRFTVEAVFRRNGMVVTYTHADVLDNIMARRTYRRIVPKSALGYYESVPKLQSPNFKEFAAAVPVPEGASYGANNKLYFGQSGTQFSMKLLLDPESAQIIFPFTVGDKQTRVINGLPLEYMVDVEKGSYLEVTILRIQVRQGSADTSYISEFVINGNNINATYKRNNIIATGYYRRALPLHFYGTFVAIPEGETNWEEFNSIFQDSSIAVADSPTTIRIYRSGADYHQNISNVFGMTQSLDIPFQLIGHTEHEILGKLYKISHNYDGGEKPTLHVNFEHTEEVERSFTVDYTFFGSGIMTMYQRDTPTGPITAKRFYRRQLPSLMLGKYESINNTDSFKAFADRISFPELTSKVIIEYLLYNGTYIQKIRQKSGTAKQELPFLLGEKHDQRVNENRIIEYTFNAWEGERIFLKTVFNEKRVNGTVGPAFDEISRVCDFTKHGYTSMYSIGNITARRIYRRIF